MTTEDFGYFLLQRPGTYYHIGAGCELPLHNAAFFPTEECAVTRGGAPCRGAPFLSLNQGAG